jgi:predicted GNAT family acetyltransferase
MTTPQVHDDPDRSRYELRVDDETVGFLAYRREGPRVVFTHAEVDPARRGSGLGAALARGALDDTVARGLRIVPRCPFVADYVERHPDYRDHVDPASPA